MIFFTTALRDDEITEETEEDDADASIDESMLDEITEDADSDSDDAEGFGLLDEDGTEDEKKKKPEEEDDEGLEEEEDADDTEYDSFDDVDEM